MVGVRLDPAWVGSVEAMSPVRPIAMLAGDEWVSAFVAPRVPPDPTPRGDIWRMSPLHVGAPTAAPRKTWRNDPIAAQMCGRTALEDPRKQARVRWIRHRGGTSAECPPTVSGRVSRVGQPRGHWPAVFGAGVPPCPRNSLAEQYRVELTEAAPGRIRHLGTDSDRVIGEILGLHPGSVSRKRRLLGIPAHYAAIYEVRGYPWTAAKLKLLGTMSDRALAGRLGVSATTVSSKRLLAGIPAFGGAGPVAFRWTRKAEALLGRMSDTEVAERLGLSTRTVRMHRVLVGIPPLGLGPRGIEMTPAILRLLKRSTAEVVEALGISKGAVNTLRRKQRVTLPNPLAWRWTPQNIARLGKWTDTKLAQAMGISFSAVSRFRRDRRIPAVEPKQRWTPDELGLVATRPDAEIAVLIGRSARSVARKRRELARV